MKIAIAGAGLTGTYLFRLLYDKGHEIDLFDHDPRTACGISPCAWGTSRGFTDLLKVCGLDPTKYFLQQSDYVVMDGYRIIADLATFHKPNLIRDLRQDATVNHSTLDVTKYDRVIDATGVTRAFLPAIREDLLTPCVQYRIRTDRQLENRIQLGRIGFAWCFPLSENEYHIGCGSLNSNPRQILEDLGWGQEGDLLCRCSGRIRLTGPQYSRPFVLDGPSCQIWGVGEAIGCVAPLAGDGIVPGMRSVEILLRCWDHPVRYTEAILREFAWMEGERAVIDKLRLGKSLGVSDAWILKKNSRRMGMKVGLRQALSLLDHLR